MKRPTIFIFLASLCAVLLTGCVKSAGKYAPPNDVGNYKWVCDEINMWFLGVEHSQNTYFIGELTLNGETTPIEVSFPIGGGITVHKFAGFDDMVYSLENMCFNGSARFHKGWFRLQVDERYVDHVGFKTLTFRRVEFDEDDCAWIEAKTAANGAATGTPLLYHTRRWFT